MNDKERLEEIEKNLDPLGYGMGGHLISVNDIYWLVKYAKEQAERVQEYDRELISLEDNKHYVSEMLAKNKRYREALVFYADEENYCVRFEDDYEPILQDNGKTARQALEGEE